MRIGNVQNTPSFKGLHICEIAMNKPFLYAAAYELGADEFNKTLEEADKALGKEDYTLVTREDGDGYRVSVRPGNEDKLIVSKKFKGKLETGDLDELKVGTVLKDVLEEAVKKAKRYTNQHNNPDIEELVEQAKKKYPDIIY